MFACPRWGSNSRPSDYETDALPTALRRLVGSVGLLHFLNVQKCTPRQHRWKCVSRESNPGQLLGRQLCSPLYHWRFFFTILLCTPKWKPQIHICLVTSTLKEKQRAIKLFTLCNKFPWCINPKFQRFLQNTFHCKKRDLWVHLFSIFQECQAWENF